MSVSAASGPNDYARLDAARTFVSDSRLALTVVNEARVLVLNRVFGVSRGQANLLTFVLALGAADAALQGARRVSTAPYPLDRTDAAMLGFVLREGAFGIAGPGAREVPLAGALLVVAMVGGLALPGLRRAAHQLRATEHRIRAQRIRVYRAAHRRDNMTAPPAAQA